MGNESSTSGVHIPINDLNALQTKTHFTLTEVRKLYSHFYAIAAPSLPKRASNSKLGVGLVVDKAKFEAALNLVPAHSHQSAHLLAHRLFEAFDTNRSGSVNFEEFIVGLSVCLRGNHKEKTTLLFRLFDLDNDGKVMESEMLELFQLHEAQAQAQQSASAGSNPVAPKTTEQLKQSVTEIYAQFAKKSLGALSLDEFSEVVGAHPLLLTFLDSGAFVRSLLDRTRYLICITGSLATDRAFNTILNVARENDEINVFYCHPPLDSVNRPPLMNHQEWERNHITRGEQLRQLLNKYVEKVKQRGRVGNVVFSEGMDEKSGILEAVSKWEIDVLVLARHEYTHSTAPSKCGVGHLVTWLTENAPCSIFISK